MAATTKTTGRWWSSLTARFTMWVAAALLAVSMASAWFETGEERRALRAQLERQGAQLAELLAASSAAALVTFDYAALDATVEAFGSDRIVRRVEIRDAGGKTVKSAGADGRGAALLVVTRPVVGGGQKVGEVTLGLSTAAVDDVIRGAWRMIVVSESAGLLVTFVLLTWLLRREVARPLRDTVGMLRDIAEGEGDLTRRLHVAHRHEVGQLAGWFNTFVERLGRILQLVRQASAPVAAASGRVSSAAGQLSAGTQEGAAAVEQTAASLEELAAAVATNAAGAREASELAARSCAVAEEGGRIVGEAVGSMNEIKESARQIGEITTAIDELAFQTNLLALNAAVEAARAGDQGRGFAVVAAEVRRLAQHSATSAKEIKGIVGGALARVDRGWELVNRSGQSLTEITTHTRRLAEMIGHIAHASTQQTTGIEQAQAAVSTISEVVQGNAVRAEDLATTADLLAAQAEELRELVARFKLDEPAAGVSHEPDGHPVPPPGQSARRRPPARETRLEPVRAPHRRRGAGRGDVTGPSSPPHSASPVSWNAAQ